MLERVSHSCRVLLNDDRLRAAKLNHARILLGIDYIFYFNFILFLSVLDGHGK